VSDHHKAAANSADSNNETLPGMLPVPCQADSERTRLRNERIEAVKAEVADAAALRSKMIDAMRRRLEAQARVQSPDGSPNDGPEELQTAPSPAPSAESLTVSLGEAKPETPQLPAPPLQQTTREPAPVSFNDIDIDSIFVPEAEANRRPVPPPKPNASFPQVWDEAFQSAQRVESALARLQEALQRDEKHGRRGRKGAGGKVAWPKRPRPLRVATLFTASFMIGISTLILAYDWRSPISLESRLAALARDVWPTETVKTANPPARAVARSEEQPLAATAAAKPKKLAIVRLETRDAEGKAGTDIPLNFKAVGGGDMIELRILGVPDTATLSAGERAKDGSWLLKGQEQKNAVLRVPAEVSGKLQLVVEALDRKSGDLAAPPQELTVRIAASKVVVEPASSGVTAVAHIRELPAGVASSKEVPLAEPPGQDIELAAVEAAAEAPALALGIDDPSLPFMARGDALMELGDVAAARSFYDRAFDLGNLRAARSIARTYDPVVLGSMKVQGLRGDAARALEWYRQAEKAGESDAAQAIAALESFLSQ
jgi:tetratricopeptide (TPR) repeat protein